MHSLSSCCSAQFTPADHPPRTLFVNIEADAMSSENSSTSARRLSELLRSGGSQIRPVAEFAERSLLTDLARLLRSADRLRRDGIIIALDDVGAEDDGGDAHRCDLVDTRQLLRWHSNHDRYVRGHVETQVRKLVDEGVVGRDHDEVRLSEVRRGSTRLSSDHDEADLGQLGRQLRAMIRI